MTAVFPKIRHLLSLAFFLTIYSCGHDTKHPGFHAKDALSTFTVADGFKLELVAAEPLISDPVDMEIDEHGRMFVVEMHGYPLDKSGSGKIVELKDSNGDGTIDQRVVFKDGLTLPNGILRWKKGFLITDSPGLLYLEDSDGDGAADRMDTVLTGFALTNPQHNANNPVYGPDNWIYIAHEGEVSTRNYQEEFGDAGREIIFPSAPTSSRLPRNANGLSVRIQPDSNKAEMLSSRCQYGHAFDAWGRLFECDNSNHIYQEVIANRYFRRNVNLHATSATQSLSDHLNAAEVFPTTTNPDRQLLTDVGVMTSACGITNYLGGAFPEPYNRATFTAEPVSNLVHVDLLEESGSTFTAKRIQEGKEFITSTDAWSRPVNFYVGPDGALYLLDYYRKVIESPEWMAKEAIEKGDLYDGVDKGRIYRIVPTGGIKANWLTGSALGKASIEELIKYLGSENYWWRINAQRLLVDKKDSGSIDLLRKAVRGQTGVGKLHALWTLQGMGKLADEDIISALHDSLPAIRENGIRLAELHMNRINLLPDELMQLKDDGDAKVRMQLLLTLGFIDSDNARKASHQILFRDIEDKWIQVAALTSSSLSATALLRSVYERYKENSTAYLSLIQRLTTIIGNAGSQEEINSLLKSTLSESSNRSAAVLSGLASGLQNNGRPFQTNKVVEEMLVRSFFESKSKEVRRATLALLKEVGFQQDNLRERSIKRASQMMRDPALSNDSRADAIRFLGLGNTEAFAEDLKKMIDSKEDLQVQLAALGAFSKIQGNGPAEYLIQQWPALTPDVRTEAINSFIRDTSRISLLLSGLESGQISTASIPFGTSVQLMQNDNGSLRNRARVIFTKDEKEIQKTADNYKEVLKMEGDAANGRKVFVTNCAICHQVRGKIGVSVGPDLGTVNNWTKEDVLANVLDPNLSIASGFDMWNVKLTSGESLQGIISSETPVSITLRNNGQLDRTINRKDIQSLRSTSISAMPAGLEKNISKQQMADLLAFLRRNQDFN